MSSLGRALKHVSSSATTPTQQPVPQHRARWQERRESRVMRQQELQKQRTQTGPVVLKATERGDTERSHVSTARSHVSTVRSDASSTGAWSRSGAAEPRRSSSRSAAKRPVTGEPAAAKQARRKQQQSPEPERPQTAAGSEDSLVRREASVALEASRALQASERTRLQSDNAERQRSDLRREVRKAIAREGVYRDPHIDAGTVVRVGMAGGPGADNRPVVDRHGRFFGMGPTGRARQVAHAQEVMAGGPLTPESNRRVLPLAVPVTPQMAGAPHSGGSPMLLHTHLNPGGPGMKQGGFARRPSAELRALDAVYETKHRGGKPRQYHHLGGARHPDTKIGAGYVVEGEPRGYITGPLTEVEWGPTAVERGAVAPSAAVASNKGGLGVREYTAVQPAVRRIGGASDPNWERRRPTLHKLHPDAEELLELSKGWNEGWGRGGARSRARYPVGDTGGWNPPLVEDPHEAHGRLVGNWESEAAAAASSSSYGVNGDDPYGPLLQRSAIIRGGGGRSGRPVFGHKSQPILYDGEYRRSLSLQEALES